MDYQERFSGERNELIEHFREGLAAHPPEKIDEDYTRQLGEGVGKYIESQGYFKFTDQEKGKMTSPDEDNVFADDVVSKTPQTWKNRAFQEILRIAVENSKDEEKAAA